MAFLLLVLRFRSKRPILDTNSVRIIHVGRLPRRSLNECAGTCREDPSRDRERRPRSRGNRCPAVLHVRRRLRLRRSSTSGSGATTLGRALSVRLGSSFLDADDYYWILTDPPYKEKRDPVARLQLILADLRKAPSSVVAGCVRNWGGELEDSFSLIVLLTLDAEIRVARLREREMSE